MGVTGYTIVIPALNERGRLRRVLSDLSAIGWPYLARRGICSIVVVDGGSTDGTVGDIADGYNLPITLLYNSVPGKGSSMYMGALWDGSRDPIFIDADLEGITREHIDYLTRWNNTRNAQQVIPTGSSPYRIVTGVATIVWPISGLRVVRRHVIDNTLMVGYLAESQINATVAVGGWVSEINEGLPPVLQAKHRGAGALAHMQAMIYRFIAKQPQTVLLSALNNNIIT